MLGFLKPKVTSYGVTLNLLCLGEKLKGFESIRKGFESIRKGFGSIPKGFGSIPKGFESIPKSFFLALR